MGSSRPSPPARRATCSPWRSSAIHALCTQSAPNPLGVLTTCVTIATIARAIMVAALRAQGHDWGHDDSVAAAVLVSIGPVICACGLGPVMHVSLAVFGRRQVGWKASLGLTMYAASAALVVLAAGMLVTAGLCVVLPPAPSRSRCTSSSRCR